MSACALSLATLYGIDKPYAFNRKEVKDHGEGGMIIGAPIQGRVCIIDDVLTSGKAVREAVALIQKQGASVAGVVVLLDRQERGQGSRSALQELSALINAPVYSVITLDDIIAYVSADPTTKGYLPAIARYRAQYAVD